MAHLVVVLGTLQNVKVPESLARIGSTITTRSDAFCPLLLRQVLRQLVLLRILDGHTRDLVAAPITITLSRRGGSRQREDTCRWLVN